MVLANIIFDMLQYVQLSNTGKETVAKFFGVDVEYIESLMYSHTGNSYTNYRNTQSMHCKASGHRRLEMARVVGFFSVMSKPATDILTNYGLSVKIPPKQLVLFSDHSSLVCNGLYATNDLAGKLSANILLPPNETTQVLGYELAQVDANVALAMATGVRKYSYASIQSLRSESYKLNFFDYCLIPAKYNTSELAVAYLAKRFNLTIDVTDVEFAKASNNRLELIASKRGRWNGKATLQLSGFM